MRRSRRARSSGFLVVVAASAVVALEYGCALQDGGTVDALAPGAGDASIVDSSSRADGSSSPPEDGGVVTPNDGASPDGRPPPFDAGCGTTFASSTMSAFPSTLPKNIDGLDDDWGCESPFEFNRGAAAFGQSQDGGYEISGLCKFEWTATELYLFCDVTDPSPNEGTNSNPTDNDAVGFYASGTAAASRTGNYGIFDHQYAVDYRNTKAEFANGVQIATPSAFTTAVHVHAGGYSVEAQIDASALVTLGSSLASGMVLGFDLEIDDGISQVESFVWYRATAHGACGSCTSIGGATCCCSVPVQNNDYPYCDALAFGSITLHP